MKNGILRDSAIFSFSRYVLIGLSFVRNFFVARILDPESYGYWVIAMLILTYGDQIHLGLRHAGDREIPFARGQGRPEEAKKTANTVYAGILWLSIASLAALGIFVLIGGNEGGTVEHLMLFAGLIVVLDQVNRYYLMIMRATTLFVLSSKIEIITETFRTLLVCILVYYFSLWGAISGFLAAAAFMTLYVLFHFRNEFVPRMDLRRLKELLMLGFSLFGVGLLYILLINADRLFAATMLSKEQLGIYGIAALAVQLPLSFTQGISAVVYPSFSETFGRSNAVMALYPMYTSVLRSLAFATPFVAVTIYFAATILIGLFLPAYRESLVILIVLLPGVFFLSFVPFLSGVFTAVNRARQFLLLELFACVCAAALFFLVQEFSAGPKGIAIAMSAGMMMYAATAIVAAFRLFSIKSSEVIKQIAGTFYPSAYCMIVMGILVSTIGREPGAVSALIAYGMFLVACIPLVFMARRVLDLRRISSMLRAPHG